MRRSERLMRSDEDTASTDGDGAAGPVAEARTPDIDGDTLLRDVDTPHLRNEVQRRLFGRVVDPVRIARFPVLRRIGQGGMGVVFAAFDNELDRKVAIKLLRPGLGDDGVALRDRLLREAKALARLSHPAIVQVYEAGEHDGQVYLAMEFVEGHTLRQWCDAEPRSVRELLEKFLQAGEGLAAAHAAGLVHRDFKPDNVIVGNDGRVRVLDFGLALLETETGVVSDAAADGGAPLDRLTRTGAMIGTPAYMAPEQLLGHSADARSDQFSFAVTLHEAIFGARPFAGETFDQLLATVLEGEITTPRGPSGAAPVARALRRALLRDREQRYRDLGELLAALRATQRRRGLAIAGIGALLAIGVTGVLLEQRSREEVASLAATVDSLGTEVQGERSRAADAEAQLRQRGDVLTLAEARFSARRDPSLALALLARLSDDDDAWGSDTWGLTQRSAAGSTAEEIVPVPDGYVAQHLVLDGRAVILQDSRSEGSVLWWPWEDRRVVLANGRHRSKRVDDRTWIVQPSGSTSSILWDLEAGTPIAPIPDVDLGWAIVAEDGRTLAAHGQESWIVVDLRTLARVELPIPSSRMLFLVGPAADWALTFALELIDSSGRVIARMAQGKDENSMIEVLGDGRFARLVGRRLQIWNSIDGNHQVVDLAVGLAPTTTTSTDLGDRIAIGDVEGRLVIVDTRSLAIRELRPTTARIDPKSWLAEGRLLFATTPEGGVLVDVERGNVTPMLQGSQIDDVRLDREQRLVGISDDEVRRWPIDLNDHMDPSGRDLSVIDGPAVDGTYVALRGDGELVRWLSGQWQHVGRHVGATTVTIAASGDCVVTAGLSGLMTWSLSTGGSRRVRDRLDEVALIEPPSVDASGRTIVVYAEKALEVIDARDGSSRSIGEGMLTKPSFAPDEPRFYVGGIRGRDQYLRRWDTETWQELPELPLSGMFLGVGAGRRLAVRARDSVTIVELGASDPQRPSVIPLGFVTGARFSGDGRMLAGIGRDGRIAVGDLTTGRVGHVAARLRARQRTMGELEGTGYLADARRVVFSPDGTRVLVVDADGALQRGHTLPPTAPDELRAWVRTHAPRLPASATLDQLAPDDAL